MPQVVRNELSKLAQRPEKRQDVESTIQYIKDLKTVNIPGSFADRQLVDYVSENRVIIATMDRELKRRIKNNGSSILSFSNDKIVLES